MKNNIAKMTCLDVYLSSLTKEEFEYVKPNIKSVAYKGMPIMSWDIHIENYHDSLERARKQNEINHVMVMAEKYNWNNDLKSEFYKNDYEALIITDKLQNIIWVNDGFSKMTGYPKKFAINKTPKFLQGEKTSAKTKKIIWENILKDKPFQEVITNYKKDRTPYKCEIKIIPLYSQETTHYIAFERKIG